MQLAKHYMRGKYVERDKERAEFLCDAAIEYAAELYSKKTRDRKIQELTRQKKAILELLPLHLGDNDEYLNVMISSPKGIKVGKASNSSVQTMSKIN